MAGRFTISSVARACSGFRPGARHRLIDARGRIVLMIEPRQLPPHGPGTLRRAVRKANSHRFTGMLIPLAAGVCIGLIIARWLVPLVITPPFFPPPSPTPLTDVLVPVGVSMAILLPIGLVLARIGGHRRGIRAMEACLAADLCPSCGYSLAGIVADHEGICQCPECGGAWERPTPRHL